MRCLPAIPEFASLRNKVEGLSLADSITGDAHKMLNVPYDCGFFLTHTPALQTAIFQNPNAAYLTTSSVSSVPSPLNIGLENSRRFRALPVYAVLVSLGRAGLAEIFIAQVRLARSISAFLHQHAAFEILASESSPTTFPSLDNASKEGSFENTHIVILFRARDEALNKDLPELINAGNTIYVSATMWEGRRAVRIAVSTWRVDVERDLKTIKGVLERVTGGL